MRGCKITWDLIRRVFVVSIDRVGKMPSEIVQIAVSTGIGVSVLAGILSGICYIVAQGLQKKRKRKSTHEWYCDVCGVYLLSLDGILEGDRMVICTKCQRRVCKSRCSSLCQSADWVCKNCLSSQDSWFQGLLNIMQPNKKVDVLPKMNLQTPIDEDIEMKRKKQREEVRDFIEKLVNIMLGDNVDDASVSKMYNDKAYLPVTGQSPCTAHTALKQIIERLLREAAIIPQLGRTQDPLDSVNESNRTYEDLLATAIINKVLSSSQSNLPNSSSASVSSKISSSSRNRHEKEYFFGEETLDTKWRTTDLETSSVSSLEDWLHSDSSIGSKKYVDRVTLTIKQDIEEVSQTDSENDEEDGEDFRTQSSLLNEDEPNWFLQKRQFQGTHSPVPVPMLVPNPTKEAKVLIGDKELDETSDLSDIASDYGEPEVVSSSHSLLLESKTVIGGKNPFHNGESESEASADSGVKEIDGKDKFEEDIRKTDVTVDDDNIEDASILSIYSNTEQDAEYIEKYGSLPRTVLKTPTPPARISLQKENLNINQAYPGKEKEENSEDEEECHQKKFAGSYSKREKEKWKNAIQMKNNPYSKENIEKRIKRSSSAVSSLFGPDYYARQASSPSGIRVKSPEAQVVWPPCKPEEEQEITITLDDDVFECSSIEPEIEANIEQASLVNIKNDTSLSEITSDSDLSYINCYNIESCEISKKVKENTILDENSNSNFVKNRHSSVEEIEIEFVKKDTPIPIERPKFLKLNTTTSRTFVKHPVSSNLRRHKSESDLLDEYLNPLPQVVQKKKRDNTLISKIYLDPQVRSFALSSRNQLPIESTEHTFKTSFRQRYSSSGVLYNSDDGISKSNFSKALDDDDSFLEYSRDKRKNSKNQVLSPNENFMSLEGKKVYQDSDKKSSTCQNNLSAETERVAEINLHEQDKKVVHPDSDIDELVKKKIVHNILDQISKTQNLAAQSKRSVGEDQNDDDGIQISVKDLRKKFENNEGTSKVISSLTARSLSKQMREHLKN